MVRARVSVGGVRFERGPSGIRRGVVTAERVGPNAVELSERGRFRFDDGRESAYRDALRFELDGHRVAVSHLRRGPGRRVHLVRLEPRADGALRAVRAHRCGADEYGLTAHVRDGAARIEWTVTGPDKRGLIRVRYTADPAPSLGASDSCSASGAARRFTP